MGWAVPVFPAAALGSPPRPPGGSAPAMDGSYRAPLCLSHSLLSLSLHPTLVFRHPPAMLRFSSLLLRPPPPLAPRLSPSSWNQSAPRFPPSSPLSLSPSSRRVSLWGRPPPPAPAPPGLLTPRPLGGVWAGLRVPDPGPAALGLLHHLVCSETFRTALSPCPLQEWRVPSLMKTRDPFLHPLLLLPATVTPGCGPRGMSLGVTAWGARPGGDIPSGAAPKGAEAIGVRAQLRGVQGAFQRVASWRVQPSRIHPTKLRLGGGAAWEGGRPGGTSLVEHRTRFQLGEMKLKGLHPRGEHLEGSEGSSPQGARLMESPVAASSPGSTREGLGAATSSG